MRKNKNLKKILIVFGTRPEAIKMALIIKAFTNLKNKYDTRICITAQHREMLDQVLEFFEIYPDYDLNLMKPNQSLNELVAVILTSMKNILENFQPDYVLVHGDTATSMAVSLAAYFSHCKVVHVEAGLRTYNKWSPFPEEMNRQITGRIADIHFAPTDLSKSNLINENIEENKIVVTGNTVIDALLFSSKRVNSNFYTNKEIEYLKSIIIDNKDIILVTGHRRENFGNGFENICNALKNISQKSDKVQIIYPVHLNPNVQEPVNRIIGDIDNINLISPLSYPAFVWIMSRCKLIITDSGGIQEEAPSLGKPVLVMRETTERPEAVETGTVILVGTNEELITSKALELLNNEKLYTSMCKRNNPYGNGYAWKKIIQFFNDL